jgi:hypothetical protein
MRRIAIPVLLLVLLACGGSSPEQMIVGKWEATMFGETMTVEFFEDGTIYTVEEDETQMWEISGEEPLILEIWDPDHRDDRVRLELVFQGNDQASLSADGMTASLKRIR